MNPLIKAALIISTVFLAACGPSKEDLARLELLSQEQARIAAEEAQKAAYERKKRMNSRLMNADKL